MSMPVLASVISFVVYSVSGHPLDPAIIFSSLSLFTLLRLPLMLLRKYSVLCMRLHTLNNFRSGFSEHDSGCCPSDQSFK